MVFVCGRKRIHVIETPIDELVTHTVTVLVVDLYELAIAFFCTRHLNIDINLLAAHRHVLDHRVKRCHRNASSVFLCIRFEFLQRAVVIRKRLFRCAFQSVALMFKVVYDRLNEAVRHTLRKVLNAYRTGNDILRDEHANDVAFGHKRLRLPRINITTSVIGQQPRDRGARVTVPSIYHLVRAIWDRIHMVPGFDRAVDEATMHDSATHSGQPRLVHISNDGTHWVPIQRTHTTHLLPRSVVVRNDAHPLTSMPLQNRKKPILRERGHDPIRTADGIRKPAIIGFLQLTNALLHRACVGTLASFRAS